MRFAVSAAFMALMSFSAVLLLPQDAAAASLESLVMPGKVIEGHAKIETQCNKCHERFSKAGQDRLCRDCHKQVDADMTKRTGYHGLAPSAQRQACKACHTDHKGRDKNIVVLDPQTFDHTFTDYPLRGRHTQAPCASCHKPGKKYRDAPVACVACHRQDDAHKGRLGKECGNCHSETAWTKFRFDHSKTRFPLRGKHREVECRSCHPNERYKPTPMACNACHQLDDVHRGRFGPKCDTCHSASAWSRVSFNHDTQTKFPLEGKHREAKCETCHRGPVSQEKLATTCNGCHRFDDEHKGQFGAKCETCHVARNWKTLLFVHNRDTHYPLRGRHEQVRCTACHTGNLYKQKLATDCYACHRGDDVHKGQQGRNCAQCHSETGWKQRVAFDHGLTRFPLVGLHAVTPCEECHLSTAFKDAKRDCNACHAAKDVHKRSLGTDCAQCHNPNGWRFWRFDHNAQTKFKLDGAHEKLACVACHDEPVAGEIRLATECNGCHATDDVHRGQFGQRCERCHVTTRFGDIKSKF